MSGYNRDDRRGGYNRDNNREGGREGGRDGEFTRRNNYDDRRGGDRNGGDRSGGNKYGGGDRQDRGGFRNDRRPD